MRVLNGCNILAAKVALGSLPAAVCVTETAVLGFLNCSKVFCDQALLGPMALVHPQRVV